MEDITDVCGGTIGGCDREIEVVYQGGIGACGTRVVGPDEGSLEGMVARHKVGLAPASAGGKTSGVFCYFQGLGVSGEGKGVREVDPSPPLARGGHGAVDIIGPAHVLGAVHDCCLDQGSRGRKTVCRICGPGRIISVRKILPHQGSGTGDGRRGHGSTAHSYCGKVITVFDTV